MADNLLQNLGHLAALAQQGHQALEALLEVEDMLLVPGDEEDEENRLNHLNAHYHERPHVEQPFSIDSLSHYECLHQFRFLKQDLVNLPALLLPDITHVRTDNDVHVHRDEADCCVLRRLAYPIRCRGMRQCCLGS